MFCEESFAFKVPFLGTVDPSGTKAEIKIAIWPGPGTVPDCLLCAHPKGQIWQTRTNGSKSELKQYFLQGGTFQSAHTQITSSAIRVVGGEIWVSIWPFNG